MSSSPITSILNPRFRYRPACATDIRITFRRLREAAALRKAAGQKESARKFNRRDKNDSPDAPIDAFS